MAWTTPKTWTAALVTVAEFNTEIRDNLNYLKDRCDSILTNKSGSNLTAGAVVIFDGSNNNAFTTTTQQGDRRVIGVLAADTNNNADGPVDVWGNRPVQVEGTVSRGEALVTGTTAGKAAGNGNYTWSEGVIGFALEGGTDTIIDALLILRPHTSQQPAAGYTAGGYNYLADTEKYDPDTWTSMTNMPSPGRRELTFRGGGPLYAIMGTDGSDLSDNDEYDPPTWTSRTSALAADSGLSGGHAGYYGGVVAVHRGATANMDEYDVSGDSWSNASSAARTVDERGSGVADNKMYEFGGSGPVAYTDEYDFAGTVSNKANMPASRSGMHGGAIDNETVIAHGGYNNSTTYYDDCYAYDPNTWTTKSASGQDRAKPAAFDIGSMYYLCYGSETGSTILYSTQEYDFSGDAYTSKSNAPSPTRYAPGGGSI